MYVICFRDLVISLFIVRLLNVKRVVKKDTLLDTIHLNQNKVAAVVITAIITKVNLVRSDLP